MGEERCCERIATLTSVGDLAIVLQSQRKYEAAEKMKCQALDGYEKALGEEHPNTLMGVCSLGAVLWGQGKYVSAGIERI